MNKKQVLGMIALIWLVLVITAYYLTHRPFQAALAMQVVKLAFQLTLMILILAICGGVGRRTAKLSEFLPLVRIAVQATLGLGIISSVILAIGSLWRFNTCIAWMLTIALLLGFYKQVWDWLQDCWQGLLHMNPAGKFPQVIAWMSAAIAIITLLIALAPPLKWDSLTYHLALPQAYLMDGRISHIPDNIFSGFPQVVHMLYLWFMGMGGEQAAVLGWGLGILALLCIWGFSAKYLNSRYAWVAISALLGGFSLASALSWGYVDWACLLVGISFLVVMQSWQERLENRYLYLAGALGGIAVAVKYTNALLPLAGLLFILRELKHKPSQMIRSTGIYGSLVLLPMLPWMLKNALSTGNPLYPLLFRSGAMDATRLAMYQHNLIGGSWIDLAFLPVRATLWGLEGAVVGDAPRYTTSIGPLLLALGTLAWLGIRRREEQWQKTVRLAGWIGVSGLLIWGINTRLVWHLAQSRLYYSIFPALAILAAAGFAGLESVRLPNLRLGVLGAALVVMVLGFNTVQSGMDMIQKGSVQVLSGTITQQAYIENNLGSYARAMQEIKDLPAGSKTLMLWEPRSFYCAPACIPDETIDRWISELRRDKDAKVMLDNWQKDDYTHLLFYQAGADFTRQTDQRYSVSDWQEWDGLLDSLPLTWEAAGSYQLYQIGP